VLADIGGGDPVSVRDLILMIAQELGVNKTLLPVPPPIALGIARGLGRVMKSPPFSVDNMLGLMLPNINDVQRASDELRFSPTPLVTGLRETFRETREAMGPRGDSREGA
jgi:nucleoside-diphosphate-sugar epimerase